MNALILGGSGALSSVLTKLLLKEHKVWTLTRGERKGIDGVTALHADRNDTENLKAVLKKENVHWDVVFDCICMNKEHAEADINILSEFTDRLIVVSTDSVYDGRYKKTPENEDGICLNEFGETKDCTYGGNKRRMEAVFLKYIKEEKGNLKITIFRPGHIYGPGFLLGCFPEHSRQEELPKLIKECKPIRLVGLGTYLIHPIYVDDLALAMIDCVKNEKTYNEIFCIGGPEAIENKAYYECIAEYFEVPLNLEEVPLTGYLDKHPEYSGHLCHRIYDLSKLKNAGVRMPEVHLHEGIELSLKALGY
ncbi:MAG: NAD-dependent epimerase/dehydratase family protein [Lachnospiraceae bacterium]|nr:NAD-dependent epimerase/dehydratase family protein [Lachnospiraceae bacterium]